MERPAFRDLMTARRCLVLADGYYEWSGKGKSRVPYFFFMRGHRAFAMAGLWDSWSGEQGRVETCTVVTTNAGRRTSGYHHRMPVLMAADTAAEWIRADAPPQRLGELLRPYDEDDLECHEVSRLVNSPANDVAECMMPALPALI